MQRIQDQKGDEPLRRLCRLMDIDDPAVGKKLRRAVLRRKQLPAGQVVESRAHRVVLATYLGVDFTHGIADIDDCGRRPTA